jgi:hypothetical protein
MPLDDSLCTFCFTEFDQDRNIVIIAQDDRSESSYYKRRIRTAAKSDTDSYCIELLDPFSQAVYGKITAPVLYGASEVSMQLLFPDLPIKLASTGKLRFEWQFQYESQVFRIRKDNVLAPSPSSMTLEWHASKAQKYDPSIAVCHLSFRSRIPKLTMLDYNIERIGIKDLKGFEVCTLLCVLFIADLWYAEGSFFQLPLESERLKQFRTPEEMLEAEAEQTTLEAARLRGDQGKYGASFRFSQFLKRRKSLMIN